MRKLVLLFLLLCVLLWDSKAQRSPLIDQFENYSSQLEYEKVYLHTNREVLTLGDTLWFSAYLVDGSFHLPGKKSKVLYVELFSPDDLLMKRFSLEEDSLGKARGEFVSDIKGQQGVYYLRAYTNYMRNFGEDEFFTKSIYVLPPYRGEEPLQPQKTTNPDLAIDFFPEGGDLTCGVINYMAVKIRDQDGNPKELNGAVYDDTGEFVTEFATVHDGMGVLQINPTVGRRYVLQYELEGIPFSVSVPEAMENGFAVNVRQNSDKFYVTIQGKGIDFDGTYLVAQCRGTLVKLVETKKGSDYLYVTIPRSELPTGITQLTFFDNRNRPQLERLIYNENPFEQIDFQITLDDSVYQKRSKVSISYDVRNEQGFGLDASMSVSVVPQRLYNDPIHSIRSYLLFSSDLKGNIHNPNHYVVSDDPNRLAHVDLLMMTHGWRRFSWKDVFSSIGPYPYQPELGFTVSGQVKGFVNQNKKKQSQVYLSFFERPDIRIEQETDEEGNFTFTNLEIYDSIAAFVKTFDERERKLDQDKVQAFTTIELKDYDYPQWSHEQIISTWDEEYLIRALDRGNELYNIRRSFGDYDIILDEIAIEDTYDPMEEFNKSEKILYRNPSYRLSLDSVSNWKMFTNVFDILEKRVPGVQVTGIGMERSAIIRGSNSFSGDNSALFLLDGVPVDAAFVNSLSVSSIAVIDVLSASSAAVYGSRASKGIIALYSRKDNYNPNGAVPLEGINVFKLFGYDATREFYSPEYGKEDSQKSLMPDYRSTIFWDPDVYVNSGNSSSTFYTSDETGEFCIYVEGISAKGIPFLATKSYKVN